MGSIRSMTGFGRAEAVTDSFHLTVEIKSVNHKYLDISVRMPRQLNALEPFIRRYVKSRMERGKIDVYISLDFQGAGREKLRYDEALAAQYVELTKLMAEEFGLKNDLSAQYLARCPGVLSYEETQSGEDELIEIVEPVLSQALSALICEREREGALLSEDVSEKLSTLDTLSAEIESMSPGITEAYILRLREKISEVLSDSQITVDESRILTEAAIYADKVSTDEETVRLRSHISAMRDKLRSGGPVGRELDFIAQEMNREANTTLSKANDLRKSDAAIAMKAEIEKIREQVQNIE